MSDPRSESKSPLPVPKTQSNFSSACTRSVFRCRDVRLQSRSFAPWNQSADDPVADKGRACHFDSNRHNNTNTKANSHVHAHGNPITIAIANRYGYTEKK